MFSLYSSNRGLEYKRFSFILASSAVNCQLTPICFWLPLTIEEQEAFINYVAGLEIYRHWLLLFTVFLGTGCRVGEIIGLRWKDCDFESRTISINHNLVYRQQDSGKCEMHITTPKTTAGCRTVPMLAEVRTALLQERKRQMNLNFL